MSAIDIFLAKGKKGLILEKDWLTRDEKEEVRARFGPEGSAGVWFLEVPEQDEEPPTEDEVVVDESEEDDSDEPTMDDLRGLTVAKLTELADKEEVDLSGLTLKDDILGRMAAHFGLDPAS